MLAEGIRFGCHIAMTRDSRTLSTFTASAKKWDAKNSFREENLWKACPRAHAEHPGDPFSLQLGTLA
jgi:hypothetical protein